MKSVSILLCSLFLTMSIYSQESPTEKASRLIDKYSELGQFNGSVLVAENDKILISKSFGTSDFEAGEKVKDNSVYLLASVSKSITSLAVLKLAEQGKLSLDDELVKYFPRLPYKGVTLKHLLSNTSGIPEFRDIFISSWDRKKIAENKDVIRVFANMKPPLEFTPGSKFKYSNTGFVFLASIIEQVTGKKFEDYLKSEIFRPAGMDGSVVFNQQKQYSIKNFAFPYVRVSVVDPLLIRPETLEQLSFLNYLDGVYGDVSTASTTEDLYKMDKALIEGKLVSTKYVSQAFTPFLKKDDAAKPEEGYGYGWYIKKNKSGEKIVMHDGTMPGVITYNYINLPDRRFIIVLSNTNFSRSQDMAEKIAAIYEGENIPDPKPLFSMAVAERIQKNGLTGLREYWKGLINSGEYEANEVELNALGYELLQGGNIDGAIEVFKINTEVFPGSWNAFDSLGEGYFTKGDKENAAVNYKKSLELNPGNENGKNFLKRIEETK